MKKSKRILSKIHNFILKAVTVIAVISFLISACSLDSVSNIPAVVCLISLLWIVLFAFSNGLIEFYERGEDDGNVYR